MFITAITLLLLFVIWRESREGTHVVTSATLDTFARYEEHLRANRMQKFVRLTFALLGTSGHWQWTNKILKESESPIYIHRATSATTVNINFHNRSKFHEFLRRAN